MIAVQAAAHSAVIRAGLEAVVRSNDAFHFRGVVSANDLLHGSSDLQEGTGEVAADVLLIALPELNDEWIAALGSYSMPVVVLAERPGVSTLAGALGGNIRAVLPPDAGHDEIAAAIQAAAAGLIAMEPAALEALAQMVRPHSEDRDAEDFTEPLTPRETEVLAMLADGLSNKAVAWKLGISEHTVKFHVTSIMAKLRAGSRTEAVTQGIRRGLILI